MINNWRLKPFKSAMLGLSKMLGRMKIHRSLLLRSIKVMRTGRVTNQKILVSNKTILKLIKIIGKTHIMITKIMIRAISRTIKITWIRFIRKNNKNPMLNTMASKKTTQ